MSDLTPDELLLKSALHKLIPLSPTTVWREEQRGRFPKRIAISTKRIAWRRSEVEAWLAARTAAASDELTAA